MYSASSCDDDAHVHRLQGYGESSGSESDVPPENSFGNALAAIPADFCRGISGQVCSGSAVAFV